MAACYRYLLPLKWIVGENNQRSASLSVFNCFSLYSFIALRIFTHPLQTSLFNKRKKKKVALKKPPMFQRFRKLPLYSHNAPIGKRNEALPYKHFVSFFIFPTFRATCFLSEKIEFHYNIKGTYYSFARLFPSTPCCFLRVSLAPPRSP